MPAIYHARPRRRMNPGRARLPPSHLISAALSKEGSAGASPYRNAVVTLGPRRALLTGPATRSLRNGAAFARNSSA